jgi:hypothetical protein
MDVPQAKWRRAQHYWKQDKRDSKKIVATVLRYLLLALELAREGAITDITLGNDYYYEVRTSIITSSATVFI